MKFAGVVLLFYFVFESRCEMPWYRKLSFLPSIPKNEPRLASCEAADCGNMEAAPDITDIKCGVVRAVQNRIVGGREASRGQFPWQAQLYVKHEGRFRLACGGTLVSHRIVVTAAHCIRSSDPNDYQVLMGKLLSDKRDTCNALTYQIVKITVHPDYSKSNLQNDIALLWVESPYGQDVQFTDYIQPACLPIKKSKLAYKAGDTGTISGWGLLEEEGKKQAETLQYVQVSVVPFRSCRDAYAKMIALDERFQFCASGGRRHQDACSGDSGGPFTVTQNGQTFLVGIVSFGLGCARESHPGVYTKLSHYMPWFLSQINPRQEVTTTEATTTTKKTTTTTTRTTTASTKATTTMATTTTTISAEAVQDGYDPGDAATPEPEHSSQAFGPICQGQFALLRCPHRKRVRVEKAFYGNDGESHCSSGRVRRSNTILMRAAALPSCSTPKATGIISKRCNGRTSCWIYHKLLKEVQDPCPGKAKHIFVYYECL